MKGGFSFKKFLKSWRKKHVTTWLLSLIFVFSVLVAAWGLHQNNVNMINLREQVLKADSNGKNVQKSLNNLSGYVFKHMNTTVTNLQLVDSYNRDVAKVVAQNKAAKPNVYKTAQAHCESADSGDASGYVTRIAQCAQDYVLSHLPKAQNTTKFPNKTLYSYSFAAPVWSPDLAGLSIILAIFCGLWLIGRALIKIVAIIIVRYRDKY